MSAPVQTASRGPGRARDATRDAAFLQAAQDLLIEVGYDRLSMESVVERVGASKSTLYRRWASKAELVSAAVAQFRWDADAPDTGSLREDLIALASIWFDRDERRDQLFVRAMIASVDDEHVQRAFHQAVGVPRTRAFEEIVRRAAARGEISPVQDLEVLGRLIPAMAFQQLAMLKRPVDRAFIVGVIDNFLLPGLTAHRNPAADDRGGDRGRTTHARTRA